MSTRGYCGIGVVGPKTAENVGTLWRSAYLMGASFVFVVGHRYRHQPTDAVRATRHVPLWEFPDFGTLRASLPAEATLVAVEEGVVADDLCGFEHPQRAVYVLGAEDVGLSTEVMDACDAVVSIPSTRSLNVAVAGSIVLYDRVTKRRS